MMAELISTFNKSAGSKPADSENFDRLIAESGTLVLVDFWASWCAPCRVLLPVLNKLTGELAEQLTLITVDADKETALAERFNVRSLPTVIMLQNGAVVDQFSGALPQAQIRKFLTPYVEFPWQTCLAQADRFCADGNVTAALDILRTALRQDPQPQIRLRLAELLLNNAVQQESESLLNEAAAVLAGADLSLQRDPQLIRLLSRLQLLEKSRALPEVEQLRNAAGKGGAGYLLDLCTALAAAGAEAESLELLLSALPDASSGRDSERIKSLLLTIINTLTDRLQANHYRQRLFSVLN